MYMDWTLILLLPGLLLGLYAQSRISRDYKRYAQIPSSRGITGAELARRMLNDNNLHHIGIEQIGGDLSDHYDPKAQQVRLSYDVYHGTSIASLGIAAHEVGHAIQHGEGYVPLHIRNTIVPMTQLGSMLYLPLLLLGMIMAHPTLIEAGILLFAVIVLFQVITLPVEFNASKRAIATLGGEGILVGSELDGAKRVLGSAALTYVAAVVTAVFSLLRLLLIFGGNHD